MRDLVVLAINFPLAADDGALAARAIADLCGTDRQRVGNSAL